MQLVKGSIAAVAKKNNSSVAEMFMNIKAFVMVDVSYSMADRIMSLNKTRWAVACEQLAQLQDENPGEIGVACFSSSALFCPSGVPSQPNGSTNLKSALNLMKQVDGVNIRLIVISDGEPDDAAGALALAQTFKSKIDTIFVGDETGRGRDFLRELAMATGGVSIVNQDQKLNLLSENITRLIAA